MGKHSGSDHLSFGGPCKVHGISLEVKRRYGDDAVYLIEFTQVLTQNIF